MALTTKAKFYYGPRIDTDLNVLDFSEGGPELNASVASKLYSPTQLASNLQDSINDLGSLTYSVVFDRVTKKITISATAPFDILIASGTHAGSNIYERLGFTGGVDLTGASSYTGDEVCGSEFVPQFYLLDYIPLENWVDSVDSATATTGSGKVEFITYGQQRRTQFSIELVTNQAFIGNEFWEPNPTGLEDLASFLAAATQKGQVEFMRDRVDPSEFEVIILESTESSQSGTGFKIIEQIDYGVGYFKSGLLRWREVN